MPAPLQPSFAGGELSPDMYGRVDINKYNIGAKRLENFFVHPHGGVSNRPGTTFVANTSGDSEARLIPFEFNLEQTYVLEFGDEYIRFHTDGGQVLEANKTITAITNDSPALVTSTSHGYADGDMIFISGVAGMTEINGGPYEVNQIDANSFELVGVDSTGFDAYTSGGVANRIYTITSPYTDDDIWNIKWTQSADVMTLTCPGFDARELRRSGNTNWALSVITYVPTIERPENVDATVSHAGAVEYRYKVTAVSQDATEESLAGTNVSGETITGATNASPIVLTITGHPYVTGDEIYVDNIVGMTEINGKSFKIGTTGANTVELQDTDGTNYGTYSSGGDAWLTYVAVSSESLDTAGRTITVEWSAVSGAKRYNVYRSVNGVYGYIGSADGLEFVDNNIIPDTGDSPPEFREPFDVDEFPSVVEYFEQRLTFARNQTLNFSQTANFHNFSVSIPARDDDAVEATINAAKVNAIRWLIPLNDLIVMTAGGTFKVSGANGYITPSDVQAKRQGSYRVENIRPMVIGSQVIYVSGKAVRDLAYSFDQDAYDGRDISILAEHLFDNRTIVNWAYAQEPDNLLWVVMSDGAALTLTYLKEQDIYAWTRHSTNGYFEDVCSVPENGTDAVYFIVRRTIDGQTRRFVERLSSRDFTSVEDAFFVDCGLTYDGAANDTISGLDHLEGEEVAVLADGNVVEGLTVEDGAITLPFEASVVHVGLGYTATMQTLDVSYETNEGTSQGKYKTITQLTLKVRRTRGLKAGPDEDNLVEIKQRENENYDTPTELATGDLEVTIEPDWRTEASIILRQDYPLPCTILSIVPEVSHGG